MEKPQTTNQCAVAAIQFALAAEEGMQFLRLWNEGEFEVCRREWPEAPASVYVGADPSLSQQPAASPQPPAEAQPVGTLIDYARRVTSWLDHCAMDTSPLPSDGDESMAKDLRALREAAWEVHPPPSTPVGAAEDMVLDAIERREERAPVGVEGLVAKWRIEDVHDGERTSFRSASICADELEAALSQQPTAVEDDRFPGGFADAIRYIDNVEADAGALYEQVFGIESDGSETGLGMLAAVAERLKQPAAAEPDGYIHYQTVHWVDYSVRADEPRSGSAARRFELARREGRPFFLRPPPPAAETLAALADEWSARALQHLDEADLDDEADIDLHNIMAGAIQGCAGQLRTALRAAT